MGGVASKGQEDEGVGCAGFCRGCLGAVRQLRLEPQASQPVKVSAEGPEEVRFQYREPRVHGAGAAGFGGTGPPQEGTATGHFPKC